MNRKLSKKFWADSTKLIKSCTDDELMVLKSRVEKEISNRCEKWDKKLKKST